MSQSPKGVQFLPKFSSTWADCPLHGSGSDCGFGFSSGFFFAISSVEVWNIKVYLIWEIKIKTFKLALFR